MTDEEILRISQTAVDIEAAGLQTLRRNLGAEFIAAARKMANCTGKIVVVGIGKSAHVGNKIVATLNSTGTPSQFLHASEAIHGDLGLIHKDDVVLCISYSGNSPEIVALLPYLNDYSAALIGMTGNRQSRLAENSDIILETAVEREACPNRLAPTTSTTVQMALGDALAVVLMEMRGFKEEDFARLHPGGSLGKNLTATVERFLSSKKPEVSPDSTVREVIISVSGSSHGVTAVTENGKILGVITDGDLRRMLLKNEDISQITAQDIMSKNPKTVEKTALAREAMQILKEKNIGQLIVTDGGTYFGVVDLHRLLDEGIIY